MAAKLNMFALFHITCIRAALITHIHLARRVGPVLGVFYAVRRTCVIATIFAAALHPVGLFRMFALTCLNESLAFMKSSAVF
jgi:hypothetical protein